MKYLKTWKGCLVNDMRLREYTLSANTGLDAIKRAPILDTPTDLRCIRITDISQGNDFEDWGYTEVSPNDYKKFKLKKNDILVARTGATVGVSYIVKEDFNAVYNNGTIRLNLKDNIDTDFVYHLFQTKSFRDYIDNISCVATQPNLRIEGLLKYDIPEIPYDKQIRISGCLNKYNELIKLNNERIKLLEQTAQEIYKEWFVRFRFPGYENAELENGIPKGWTYVPAQELCCVLRRGISPTYDDNGDYLVISQKCIRGNVMDIREARMQSKEYSDVLNLQDGDTVICSTGTGTLGRVGRVIGEYKNTTYDSHVTLARAKKTIGKHFLYGTLKNLQSWFMSMGIGSTNQQELYISTIRNAKVLIPADKELLDNYEGIINPIHKKIGTLIHTNENLIKQRDYLLPRLIAGKLEV